MEMFLRSYLAEIHELIKRWKLKEALRLTLQNRPELLKTKELSDLEMELLNEIKDE